MEIDRGDEVVSDPNKGVLKSIVFYLNYWAAKKFTRYEHDFDREFKVFRTLYITHSPKRLQNIREAVTNYSFPNKQVKHYLWGSIDVTKDNLFQPIWQSLDITDQTQYKIG